MTESTVPTFGDATRTWLRIGLLSFGGPAGQIALMHRVLVEEKRWISEQRFLHALSYCLLLPGPEAQQLATYVGWLLHGTRGGLVAGILFVLPGFLVILALSFAYVLWRQQPLLAGVFLGLKVAVIALMLQAMLRLATRALRGRWSVVLALGGFVAMTILQAPFPLVVLAAGIAGYLLGTLQALPPRAPSGITGHTEAAQRAAIDVASSGRGGARAALRAGALGLLLWFAPVLLCAGLLGKDHLYTELGIFFSKMAVVTFGGAYAVLSYVAQQAVERFAWITPGQMLDGLGLAESTPGPLILVVQFVGFLAAYQMTGMENPLLAGTLAALITVWVTFVPCFLWIFLGAPYIERLRGKRHWDDALAGISAAVVGVIASLALWFALHVLFARVTSRGWPEVDSLQWTPALLTLLALFFTFALRWPLWRILAACVVLGAATTFA